MRYVESRRSCPICDRVTYHAREILVPPRSRWASPIRPLIGLVNALVFTWDCRECAGARGSEAGRIDRIGDPDLLDDLH